MFGGGLSHFVLLPVYNQGLGEWHLGEWHLVNGLWLNCFGGSPLFIPFVYAEEQSGRECPLPYINHSLYL